jgi:hypothetical protein
MRICKLPKQTTTIPGKQVKKFGVLKGEAFLLEIEQINYLKVLNSIDLFSL